MSLTPTDRLLLTSLEQQARRVFKDLRHVERQIAKIKGRDARFRLESKLPRKARGKTEQPKIT